MMSKPLYVDADAADADDGTSNLIMEDGGWYPPESGVRPWREWFVDNK